MLQKLRDLLEMIRFSHTLFALPFALVSAALAWKVKPEGFSWLELLAILLCMVFARSAAMAFNRLADRDIDAANPRTAGRHLPAGKLSHVVVWRFTFICGLGFIATTGLFLFAIPLNPWPLILSLPVLVFLFAYSFTKRITWASHFWLGASLMLAPLAAWIAILGLGNLITPILLGLAVLFWVAGFDIIYACQDEQFDRKAQLASIPAKFGVAVSLRIALVCHLVMVALLVALTWASPGNGLGLIWLVGVTVVAGLLVYEHSLVSPTDLTRVNQAFFLVNAVVSIGLLLVVLLQFVLPV